MAVFKRGANPCSPRRLRLVWVASLLFCLFTPGCREAVPAGALVLTQIPVKLPTSSSSATILDQRYPAGSRVVLVTPPFTSTQARILSTGLVAAGDPVVCPSGQRIFFVGKASATEAWQVYLTTPRGGRPKAVTDSAGGAMDPAVVGNGDLVFSSPVPRLGETWKTGQPTALYRQSSSDLPQRLTFGVAPATDPTVLRDGTILFVSVRVSAPANEPPHLGLFTINDDGTEVTAFALDHDGVPLVRRPRELLDGRVGFLAMAAETGLGAIWAEGVRLARPFASRTNLFQFPASSCRSVEPDGQVALLACLETRGMTGRSRSGSYAVFRVSPGARDLGTPLFDDPAWHNIEAVPLAPRPKPMGHVSAINPSKKTGTILCLNANFTRPNPTPGSTAPKAGRVRVLARNGRNQEQVLGEIALQADGSFMATVPAEIPIGFEALDDQDRVVRRLPPSLWLRRGENRSCLGCHEPYNRSPRNVRPIAAGLPPVNLGEKIPAARP